jgi:hypothetical protein
LDTAAFSQFLAKITHGFVISHLGMDGFSPLLPEFILKGLGGDNSLSHYHLVRGDARAFAPSSTRHSLGWGACPTPQANYLFAYSQMKARRSIMSLPGPYPRAISNNSRLQITRG